MSRSLVIWRGPSRYDGEPVRAVLTLEKNPRKANRKTGPMAQLFILRDDIAPHTAQKCGADRSVCGECPFRPALNGGCYVTTFHGPASTWRATRSNPVARWPEVSRALEGRSLRLGAYGDVAALPPEVVSALYGAVQGRVTGYTHGHRLLGMEGVSHLRTSCMLSVETEAQAASAHAAGWRTFRGRPEGAPLMRSEIECPNESRGISCADCLLCCGASKGARSVSIPVHGFATKRALRVVSAA
jgi:hypothetical protein